MVLYLHPQSTSSNALNCKGTLAQLVEQWTENPCVPGSIPGGTTKPEFLEFGFFVFIDFQKNTRPQNTDLLKKLLCTKKKQNKKTSRF